MNRKKLTTVMLIGLLASSISWAVPDGEMAPNDKELAQAYWRGQEALKKADWNSALQRFQKLEQDLRRKEPQTADSAVYWQAYTLLQARRINEANAALDRLSRDFPASRWKKEADTLRRQVSGSAEAAVGAGKDDDLAGVAVESLLHAPADRALPILRKVLASSHPIRAKKRALFVLSQIDEPAALESLNEIAARGSEPELRDEAIRMLGISGNKRTLESLSSIYASSQDVAVRSRIVQAWMLARRSDLILDAARKDANVEVRAEAIQMLGAMQATQELRELAKTETVPANRRAIVQALGIAGDVPTLASIAADERDADVQAAAIQAIGIAGGKPASEALVKVYASSSSQRVRDAALQGLLITGDSEAMRTLYKSAKTNEEKKAVLRMLTLLKSDDTLDLIESELKLDGGQR
jgi:HEAT repeat protein